jgi:hypothetical protein
MSTSNCKQRSAPRRRSKPRKPSNSGVELHVKIFAENLLKLDQKALFAGVGAHHHNGIAKRHIQTIMAIKRLMIVHSAVYWPMAVRHAVYIWNRMPSEKNGLSPIDIFTRTRWPQAKFRDLHVWGCPVYVLDHRISGGKKIPRWEPRSERSMYMGMSDWHSSTVPLVLNLESGAITPQFHVTFDDWFATVVADPSKFPDFDIPDWHALFGELAYQYLSTDEDEEVQEVPPPTKPEQARERRLDQLDALHRPAVPLNVLPLPTTPAVQPTPPAPDPTAQATPPIHSVLPATPPWLNPTFESVCLPHRHLDSLIGLHVCSSSYSS